MKIIDFDNSMLFAASRLAEENYAEEWAAVPSLPCSPDIPDLSSLAKAGLAVAAFEGDDLIGYLGAYGPWSPVFCTPDTAGVFSPLHCHAAVRSNRKRIYQRMYQAAAEKWVRAGAASHAIALYAHDTDAREAFFQYGFGMRCMDLIRPLDESITYNADIPGCSFIELPVGRHRELRDMRQSLSEHLSQSPCFMLESAEEIQSWVERKEKQPPRVFAAEIDRRPVAYMEICEDGENFAVCSSDTRNICGAFCQPQYRGSGIAIGLLGHITTILRSEGFVRLGVDCESFNPTALNFWSRHFSVYTQSVVRRIDENILDR